MIASTGPEQPLAAVPCRPLPLTPHDRARSLALALVRRGLGVAGFGVDALWLLSASATDAAVDELISIAEMMDLVALVQLASPDRGRRRLPGLAPSRLRRHPRTWRERASLPARLGDRRLVQPVANLVIPSSSQTTSERAGTQLRPRPGLAEPAVAALVHWWWVCYLVGSGLSSRAGDLIGEPRRAAR